MRISTIPNQIRNNFVPHYIFVYFRSNYNLLPPKYVLRQGYYVEQRHKFIGHEIHVVKGA